MNPKRHKKTVRRFTAAVWLPHPRARVFEFFKQAHNLQKMTPDWLNFKILTPAPVTIKKDAIIDYALGLFGVGFKWRTRISDWQPPQQFTDVQERGPYKVWEHTHIFEEKEGGTLMRDVVDYLAPGGILEPLINKLFVAPQVRAIFEFRRQRIAEAFAEFDSIA